MKKLMVLGALSLFAFAATPARACDGMKGQHGDSQSQTQASKGKAKQGKTKTETGGETTKS